MRRQSLLLPVVLALLFSLAFQGSRGLWEPDEGRYTNIATEMLRSGSFMVPALNGEHPHFTKPPLTYWAIAGGLTLLGWNEWGARLPNALAYFATILTVLALARRLMPERAWLAPLVYASLLLPYLAANIVTTDTLLSLWEAVAMLGFVEWWGRRDDGPGRWPRLLMWVGFGLAFFTKGPPGLVPLLAVVAFLFVTGERRRLREVFYPPGLLLFALIGLSWYGIVIGRRPELLHYFIKDEFIERIATAQRRRNAQWYGWLSVYFPTLLIGLLPWSLLLFRRIGRLRRLFSRRWWREQTSAHPTTVLVVLWIIVPLAVFCLARSRLPLYILPLFVPLALAITLQLPESRSTSKLAVAATALWFVVLVGGRWVGSVVHSDIDARPLALAIRADQPENLSEIVFVDDHPYWALSLYLRAEVEMVTFEPDPSAWWANSTLDAELDEHEAGTLFVVSRAKLSRFQTVLAERQLHAHLVGSDVNHLFTVVRQADDKPWPSGP